MFQCKRMQLCLAAELADPSCEHQNLPGHHFAPSKLGVVVAVAAVFVVVAEVVDSS